MTKGIVSSSGAQTTFDSSTGPSSVQFSKPGASGSVFQGILDSESIRTGTSAVAIDANALNVAPGDLLRVAVVIDNQSTTGSAFDVTFRDVLAAGTTYVAGSLTVVNGVGDRMDFRALDGSSDGAGFFTSGIILTDSDANDSSFEAPDQCGAIDAIDSNLPGQNLAIAVYDVQVNTLAGSSAVRSTSAVLSGYASKERGVNLTTGVSDVASIQVEQIDLSVATSVSNASPLLNDVVTWTVVVTNEAANATAAATGVVVQDRLPAGYRIVAGSAAVPAGSTFDESSGVWVLGNPLPAGQTAQLTFRTVVANSAVAPGDFVDLELESDFDLAAGASLDLKAGQTISYTVTVRNDAEAATVNATGVTVGRLLPAGVTLVSATEASGTFDATSQVWDLSSTSLAVGQSSQLTIQATVNAAAAGTDLQLLAEVLTVIQADVDSVAANASVLEDDDATGRLRVLPAAGTRTVSGRVFDDVNQNGIDNTESGIAGIRVQLVDSAGAIAGVATTSSTGSYSIVTATTEGLRLEFSGLSIDQSVTTTTANSVSSLAFIDSGATNVTANLAVYQPDIQVDLVTTCFVYSGQSTHDPTTEPALVVFRKDGSVKSSIATVAQVGSTNGLAIQPFSGDTFVGAFHKRHSDVGPSGNSAIYRVSAAGAVTTFIQLDNVFGAGYSGAAAHDSSNWFTDAPAFSQVGRIALGDLDVSDDGRFLYTINLATRELIQIPVGSGTSVAPVDYTATDSRTVRRFSILGNDATAPTNGGIALNQLGVDAANNIRPFALKVVGDIVYVGMTNTAQTTDDVSDLRSYIYEFNAVTGSFASSAVADFALGPRTASGGWEAWSDDWNEFPKFYDAAADNFTVGRSQPWMTDIELDNDGNFVVGFRDRTADQVGHMVGDPTGADSDGNGQVDRFFHDSRGDVLKLRKTGARQWEIEPGPLRNDGSEFYFEDAPLFDSQATVLHPEATQGGLIQVPGWTDITSTAIDPQSFWAGGILTLDNITGQQTDQLDVYTGSDAPDIVSFGKNNGLGDLEYRESLTLEIGNRIWLDENRNGLQDAGEPGIAAVDVQLFDVSTGSPVLVGSTTTGPRGEYVFNRSNVAYIDGGSATGVRPLTDYRVAVAAAEFLPTGSLNGLSITRENLQNTLVAPTTLTLSASAVFDSNSDGALDTARSRRLDVLSTTGLRADGVQVIVLNATGGIANVDEDGAIVFDYLDGSVGGTIEYSVVDNRLDSDAFGFDQNGDGQIDSALIPVKTGATGQSDHSFDFGFVANRVDLEVEKWVDQKFAAEGDVVTYTVQVTNATLNEAVTATGVSLIDVVPAGITIDGASVTTSQGTFASGIWTLSSSLQPGETATLRYQATVNSGTSGSRLVGTAQVRTLVQPDVDSAVNNDDSDHSEDDEDDATTYVLVQTSTTAVNRAQVIAANQRDFDSAPQNDNHDQSEDDESSAALTISTNVNVFDFGDLPNSYGTTTASNGPAHRRGSATFLGTAIDDETDGQPSDTASLEGADDDGVRFLTPLVSGQTAIIGVQLSTAGFLNAWIDFDSNGTLDEINVLTVDGVTVPSETSIRDLSLTAGLHVFTFSVPSTTITNPAARFRITSAAMGAARSTGGIFNDGEVEDYILRQLGDQVFYDLNANGILDATTDFPLAGVTITLQADLNGDNVVEQFTTTTDASGNYRFTGLPIGSYTVSAATPTGYTAVYDVDGGLDSQSVVALTEAVLDRVDVDFGFRGTGRIGDTLWQDDNADGVKQSSEVGLAGLTVALTGDLNSDSVTDITVTTTTNQNGEYLFSQLLPGNYTVTVSPPADMNSTFDADGLTTANQSVVSLTAGQQRLDQDFGYRPQGSAANDVELIVTKDNVNPRDLAAVGAIVEYIITVTNQGPADALNAVIQDTIPAQFTSATWTATGSLRSLFVSSGTGNLNETISVPSGATITYRVRAALNESYVGTVSNSVTVTTSQTDSNLLNNTATDVTSVTQLTLTPENTPQPGQPFQLGARGMSHVALLPFIVGTRLGSGVINGIQVDIADPQVFMIGFVCVDDRIIAVYDIPETALPQAYYFQTYEATPTPRLSNVIQYVSAGAQVLASAAGSDVVTEGQGDRQIQVSLNQQPKRDVKVLIQNDAPNRLNVAMPEIVFTPDNWQQPQTVTVSATDDSISYDDLTAAIRIGVADDDLQFADALEQKIDFKVIDNDDLTTPELAESWKSFDNGNVTINWGAIDKADSYELWIAPTVDVPNPVFRGSVEGNQFVAEKHLPVGKFAVWVRAQSADGKLSGWSNYGRIDVLTSTTVQSVETEQANRPLISWDEISGAVNYEIWINNRTAGNQKVVHRRDLTDTKFVPEQDLGFGTHLVWVRAINQYGNVGKWSRATTVNMGPTLLEPEKVTFDDSPTFRWTTSSGASTWEIYLQVQGQVIRKTGIVGGQFTFAKSLPEGTHQWWVRGFNSNGIAGGWSSAGELTVGGRPKVLNLMDSAGFTHPLLSWTAVSGFASYDVYLSRIDIPMLILNKSGVTESSLQLQTDLEKGTYRLWVRAISQTGKVSYWSRPLTFDVG